ncbi:MAG: sulfite exporter TauE/SafE family protein [Desulfobacteraceae bacterium]|nr:MAG: sulfite exporter TauE/SafE family protein [Desulfobacteraceae bacterium]
MLTISASQLMIILPGLFAIAFVFSMFGRGGGEFILPLLITVVAAPFFHLATVSLFLIFSQGTVMLLVYGTKHKLVDWTLAFSLAIIVAAFAFLGGYLSFHVKPIYLKGTFALVLLISAYKIWQGKKVPAQKGRLGTWHRKMPGENGLEYDMNFLYIVAPVGIIAFVAGMLGISGCGLIIPICIILGGVPMRVAIGSNTMLVLTSSGSSFVGHIARGHFPPWQYIAIFAGATICGALLGSRTHVKISDEYVKKGFITILVVAAVWMVVKIYLK